MEWIGLPVVVDRDKSTGRIKHSKDRVGEHTGKPKPAKRWPQRAKHYGLGIGSANDKPADQNVVIGPNETSGRDVERLRPHCRELRIFQMNRNGVVCSVTADGWILIIENPFAAGVQARELREGGNIGRSTAVNERVID